MSEVANVASDVVLLESFSLPVDPLVLQRFPCLLFLLLLPISVPLLVPVILLHLRLLVRDSEHPPSPPSLAVFVKTAKLRLSFCLPAPLHSQLRNNLTLQDVFVNIFSLS